jgi:CDP-4-dehydro-6-deoxyglucose reductase, E1
MKYPLLENAFSKEDLQKGINVLKTGRLTISKITHKFEKTFAKKNESNFALMCNSGSSANLLMVAAACNPLRKNSLKKGDEVILPAICWSTSLWPLVQHGLKPIFVDIDIKTLNISIKDLKKKITEKTKAIMCVHILGVSTNMSEILSICKKKKLMLFEDTCESLGSKFKKKKLGNFGDFASYSFYYSHQITSGEGGMVVCKNKDDYELLKCLRSHGWSRNTKFHNYYKKKYKNLDEKFLFINSGYNLRPLDVTAAIANNQYKRLDQFMKTRSDNRKLIIDTITECKKWNNQFIFIEPEKEMSPSWFGLPILINKRLKKKKTTLLRLLDKKNIENRPIVSGNFLNQPAIKLYNLSTKNKFFNSQLVEESGFFIGLHTKKITKKMANYIATNLLKIDEI